MHQDRLKIAFLHRANDPYTLERIKYFIGKNYDVYSVIFDLGEKVLSENKANVIKLKKSNFNKIPFAKRIIHFFEIKKILRQIEPDVFHIVNALNLLYLSYNQKCLKVVENQGSDVIDSPSKYRLLKLFYKFMYRKADAVVQDSQIAYEFGVKYGAPADDCRNQIIEIGIDFDIFNKNVPEQVVRKKYNLEDRKIVFYSRSVVDPLYNIDIVFESMLSVRKIFPDCVYIITAKKEQISLQLMDFVKHNNLEENTIFAGYQDRIKDLKYFYRDADVNISVPSTDSSPFSVYESMACLTPNIVTDLPWVNYKFIPGKHLLVCPVRDSKALAENTIIALKGEHHLDLMSAYDIVYEKINISKENEKLESLYKKLLIKKNYKAGK